MPLCLGGYYFLITPLLFCIWSNEKHCFLISASVEPEIIKKQFHSLEKESLLLQHVLWPKTSEIMCCDQRQFEWCLERCSSSQSIISFQATIFSPHTSWQPNEYDFFFYAVFFFLLSLKNQWVLCQDCWLRSHCPHTYLDEYEKIELVCFTTSASSTCVDFEICSICSQHGFRIFSRAVESCLVPYRNH